jgi:hypothetical protein
MSAAGWVLAAGGVVAANELVFAPLEQGGSPWDRFNWRIIPATAILALVLSGFEKVAPQFGNGLGIMAFMVAVIAPLGNAPPVLDNVAAAFNPKGGKK